MQNTVLMWALFWSGASILMFLAARVVFREQLHELKTIRKVLARVGPYFPEFDTGNIRTWVGRCAPHVWRGWRTREYEQLGDFATPEFLESMEAVFAEERRAGVRHEADLEKLLAVHPLGVYPAGEGPPPRDVELVLRIECKGVDCVRGPDGAVVGGDPEVRQVQHIWTLRHDGRRWRLLSVVDAPDEITHLREKPELPPLMEWRRPEGVSE